MTSINQLNDSDKALLESIMSKDLSALTVDDIAILNARRIYLNYPQRQAYKGIIIDDFPTETPANPTTPQQPTQYTDPTVQPATPAVDNSQIHNALIDEAKSLEVELNSNETDEELELLIGSAKAEDIKEAESLGIDITGMSPVEIMNAVKDKTSNGNSEAVNPFDADPNAQA